MSSASFDTRYLAAKAAKNAIWNQSSEDFADIEQMQSQSQHSIQHQQNVIDWAQRSSEAQHQ